MKLGIIKRILKEDLARSGDVPAWIDAFLQPLNEFIEKVGLALQGRLTLSDNFLGKAVTQSFTSAQTYTLNPQLSTTSSPIKVTGCLVLDAGGATVTGFKWLRNTNGSCSVTITFSDVTTSTCTVYFLLG